MILSVALHKGGVGKTTTAFNLSAGLAKEGKNVLLVSLESQGNLNTCVGYEKKPGDLDIFNLILDLFSGQKPRTKDAITYIEQEGFWYIPSDVTVENVGNLLGGASSSGIKSTMYLHELFKGPEFEKFDYIILDCRPTMDFLLQNAINASDKVIIPITPHQFSLEGIMTFWAWQEEHWHGNPVDRTLGFLITVADRRSKDYKNLHDELTEAFGKDKVFKSVIPYIQSENRLSVSNHRSAVSFPNSKIGAAYMDFTKEVIEKTQQ